MSTRCWNQEREREIGGEREKEGRFEILAKPFVNEKFN